MDARVAAAGGEGHRRPVQRLQTERAGQLQDVCDTTVFAVESVPKKGREAVPNAQCQSQRLSRWANFAL